jgi:hypothetical protein
VRTQASYKRLLLFSLLILLFLTHPKTQIIPRTPAASTYGISSSFPTFRVLLQHFPRQARCYGPSPSQLQQTVSSRLVPVPDLWQHLCAHGLYATASQVQQETWKAALFYVALLGCICILACLGLGYNLRVIKPYLRWRQTTRDEETQQWEKIDLERNEHNMMGSALMTEKAVGDVQHVEEKFKVGKECATMGTYQGNSNANEVIGKSNVGNAE